MDKLIKSFTEYPFTSHIHCYFERRKEGKEGGRSNDRRWLCVNNSRVICTISVYYSCFMNRTKDHVSFTSYSLIGITLIMFKTTVNNSIRVSWNDFSWNYEKKSSFDRRDYRVR